MTNPSKTRRMMAGVALLLVGTGLLNAEPLLPHPALGNNPISNWNGQLGKFGESLVRELQRARGHQVFNLNVGEQGIDGLIRSTNPDGRVTYKVIEVKTVQSGSAFQLGDTSAGRQLSARWIEDRLVKAATQHADAQTRKAAAEALQQFRSSPASVRAELHGISIADNRYIVKSLDPVTGVLKGEVANCQFEDMLKELSQKATSKEIRQAATRHLADYKLLQGSVKPPHMVRGSDGFTQKLAQTAGVDERQAGKALQEASSHIRAAGQSRWVKVGGKMFKFIGKAAGPAGVAITAVVYTLEAAEIEQKVERGELTREQADADQGKLGVRMASAGGGTLAGAASGSAIGTFLCPGPGTVVGGIVGAVGGCVGAELVMAATGLTDTLGEFLAPGVEVTRKACAYIAEKGMAVTSWAGNKLWQAGTATTQLAVKAGNAAKDVAVKAGNAAKDAAVKAGNAAKDAANWMWKRVRSGWGIFGR